MPARWPLHTAPFWARAPFFHVLLPLIAAILCYDRSWLSASPYWGIAACVLLAALILFILFRKQSRTSKALFSVGFYVLVFCFGVWRTQEADIRTHKDWFAKIFDTTGASLVRIAMPPSEKERIWRMQVSILKNTGSSQERAVCGEAFLNVYKNDTSFPYHEGDLILVPAHWQQIANSGNPFEVDFKTMNRRRGICHQQFIAPDKIQLFRKVGQQPEGILAKAHAYCNARLVRYVKDSAAYGLLQAMLLGDEGAFDPGLRQAYSETGVIHIVSISGSHVGVLFAAVAMLLSGIRGRKGSWLRFGIGLFVIWFYVLMAGAPPSALRAALMFSVLAFGTAFSREAQPVNTLFAAAVALLCSNPVWLFSVGFQLSFGAVLSLILFYDPVYKVWPQTNAVLRWLWRGLAASFAAEVLTAPLVIYYFHIFPLFFMIANLLAAALLGFFALLGGMLIIILSFLPPLAKAVAWAVTLLVQVFNKVIIVLQGWNPTSFRYLQIDKVELILLFCCIAGFAVYFLQKKKPGLWLGMSTMLVLLAWLCVDKLDIMDQERLAVYNTSRHTTVERIAANHYYALLTDSTKGEQFATRAAHTGWGAWRPGIDSGNDYFRIRNTRVLILKSRPAGAETNGFKTDILIVACPLKGLSPGQLKQLFHPQKIIAGGAQPRWVVEQWKEQCAAIGQSFHAVSKDGAFILE